MAIMPIPVAAARQVSTCSSRPGITLLGGALFERRSPNREVDATEHQGTDQESP